VAEQFAFDHTLGEGLAVDRDEGSVGAVERDGATRRTIATSCLLCGLSAMKPAAVLATSSCWRSWRFSRCSEPISIARATVLINASALSGFVT
jgi:hypothetical protein